METIGKSRPLPEEEYATPDPLAKRVDMLSYEHRLAVEKKNLEQSIASFTDASREKAAAIAINLDAILTRLDLMGAQRFSKKISSAPPLPLNTQAVISYRPGSLKVNYFDTTNDGFATNYIVHTTGKGTMVKKRPIGFMSALSLSCSTIAIIGATQVSPPWNLPFIFPFGMSAIFLSVRYYLNYKNCAATSISQLSNTDATTFLSYLYAAPLLTHQAYEEVVGRYAVPLKGDLDTLALKTAAVEENLRAIRKLHV